MRKKLCVVLSRKPRTDGELEFVKKIFDPLDKELLDFVYFKGTEWKYIDSRLKEAKIIVPMGAAQLHAVLGIKKIKSNRGKHLFSDKYNCKIVPTLAPYDEKNYNEETDLNYIKSDMTVAYKLHQLKEDVTQNYIMVGPDQRSDFDRLMNKLETIPLFSFDIEVEEKENYDVNQAHLLGIGFSWKMGTGVYVVLKDQFTDIPKDEYNYRIMRIKKLLSNDAEKVAHNFSYEKHRLRVIAGIEINNMIWDTMLMHHLYDENYRHGLDQLSDVFAPDLASYKDESTVFLPKKDAPFTYIPTVILARRCCADCDLTLRLYFTLKEPLKEQHLMPLYNQIVIPHRHIVTDGEVKGIRIDRDELDRIDPIVHAKMMEKLEMLFEVTGDKDFNPRSPQQVQKKLEKFGLSSSFFTDTGAPATNVDAMNEIMDNSSHPFPKLMIEYRQLSKLYSTYIEGIRNHLVGDIIHTSFLLHGTVTGRLSSRNPNLQNMPTDAKLIEEYKLPEDISIKKLFIPREDHVFVVSDGSQMELRILAVASRDPILINAYLNNEDIHVKTAVMIIPGAQEVYDALQANPDDEQLKIKWAYIRRIAKTVNFGIVYGIGAPKLANGLKISVKEAQNFLDRYFEEYVGVYQWIQETLGFAKRYGYVVNLFGRRRRLPDINSFNFRFRSEAERQAQNSPIQGGAADCTAIANLRVAERFVKNKINGSFILNVHDELVHEVHKDCADDAAKIVEASWLDPIPRVTVPLGVSVGIGNRWEH
jgi:DNA polymerase-1